MIRKNDTVMVITGREKGKTGKVLLVDKDNSKLLIQGVNFVKRHQRPTQKQKRGGVVEKEAPVHISNVMFYDEKLAKPTRLGHKMLDTGKKVRLSKKSGEVIDTK